MINIDEKKCFCSNCINEGVFEKCFENKDFSIYGHLTKECNILIKYHAKDKFIDTGILSMSVKFNDNDNLVNDVSFVKCKNSNENDFCYLFNLENYNTVSFGYENNHFHSFKISEDPFKAIIARYHLESNNTLPTIANNTSFLDKFQKFFSSLLCLFKPSSQ